MSNPWEPAAPDPTPSVPAGWYPDPAGSGGQRWWDGTQWSEHVQPPAGQVAAADAAPTQPAEAAPAAPASPAAPAYPGAPVAYGATAYGTAGSYAPAPGYNQYVQARSVGFGQAVSMAFKNWKDYSGRSTLSEFWWFFLFLFIVEFVIGMVAVILIVGATAASTTVNSDGQLVSTGSGAGLSAIALLVMLVLFAVWLVLFLTYLPLTVRRLHDTDKSGWFYLLVFIPFGSIIVLVLCAMASTPGPNQYGPVPQ